jgi:hypothetical protein
MRVSAFIEPCLPSPADRPPSGPDWIHEIKLDGFRMMVRRGRIKGAQYLSQKQNTATRKRLAAAKLRLKLGGWPDIREPLPRKAKWKHEKRYQRLRNQVHALEAQAKQTRFRKEIDIRTFGYHAA